MAQLPGDFLIYNNVKLYIVRCEELSQRAVFTPDGIDYLYTHVRGTFQCLYNYGVNGALPPDVNRVLRPLLTAPRAQLIFGFNFLDQNNVNIVSNIVVSPPNGTYLDMNNGPIPEDVTIHRMDGAQTFHVRFVINTFIREDSCFSSAAVLSNRYSQAVTVDQDFYTTLRTTGTTYFNSSFLANNDLAADRFRRYLFPPIPYGFKRDIIDMQVDSKKNVATWTVVDTEQAKNIGESNTNGSGLFITRVSGTYHIETMPAANIPNVGPIPGGMSLAVVSIDVTGSKFASSWVLIQYGVALATTLLPLGLPPGSGGGWVRSIAISKDLIRNAVSIRIAYIIASVNNAKFFVPDQALQIDNIFTNAGNNDDGTNPSPPSDGGSRGTSNILALEAALKTTCTPSPNDVYCQGGLEGGVYSGCPDLIQVQGFYFIPYIKYQIKPGINTYTKYSNRVTTTSDTGTQNVPNAYYRPGLNLSPDSSGGSGGSSDNGDAPLSENIQPKQPQVKRKIEGEGERIGGPPQIPVPQQKPGQDGGSQWVPFFPFPCPAVPPTENMPKIPISQPGTWQTTKTKVVMENVELMPDMQTLLYRASWVIEQVAILDPSGDPGLLAFSIPPWINYELGGQDNNGNQIGYTTEDLNNGTGIMS